MADAKVKWVLVVSGEMNGMDRKIDVPVRVLDGNWSTLNEVMEWGIDNPDQVFIGGNKGTMTPVPVTVPDVNHGPIATIATCGCKVHSSGVKVLCPEHTREARNRV